jgi:hypothetical protein
VSTSIDSFYPVFHPFLFLNEYFQASLWLSHAAAPLSLASFTLSDRPNPLVPLKLVKASSLIQRLAFDTLADALTKKTSINVS